jgi:hypothetical protein
MRKIELTLIRHPDPVNPGVYVKFYIEPQPNKYKHLHVNKYNIGCFLYKNAGYIAISIQQYSLQNKTKKLYLAVLCTESPVCNLEIRKFSSQNKSRQQSNHNGE